MTTAFVEKNEIEDAIKNERVVDVPAVAIFKGERNDGRFTISNYRWSIGYQKTVAKARFVYDVSGSYTGFLDESVEKILEWAKGDSLDIKE